MSARRPALVVLGLAVSETAYAHSPIQGIGNFYNGLLHPVLVPAHLLLLMAVGLFLGQQSSKQIELVLGVFAAATSAGITAAWLSIGNGMEAFILSLSAVVGLLIATSPRVALPWRVLVALAAGFFLGIDSAQDELSGRDKVATLFGSAVAIYFLVLYPIALADYFNKKAWQKIGIRIAGSWVAASSLLVLALSFSPQAQT